jgi:hypothetical protein
MVNGGSLPAGLPVCLVLRLTLSAGAAGLVHRPGFANLSCLGRLSDLIFSGYVSLPFADGMRTESPVVHEPRHSEKAHTQIW